MKISIIGTGYVGLVSGTCLASCGHHLICVDIRPDVVNQINRGVAPIYEVDLEPLLAKVIKSGNLTATTDLCMAVRETDVTLICVGTPTVGNEADLSQIKAVANAIGDVLATKSAYHVIVVKSTVLPGTTEETVCAAVEGSSGKRLGDGWGLCMNPEFLREGQAIEDFKTPDRIVLGVSDGKVAEVMGRVYESFTCPKLITTPKTAEMIKYVANSMFATLISFANEVGNLCSSVQGVDAREVWRGVHLDRRLTPLKTEEGKPAGVVEYLWHGLGFGGSCFPKDVAALRGFGQRYGTATRILDAVLDTNEAQPLRILALLEQEMVLKGKRIAILGLAFKPGTDDVRHSPALPIIAALKERGAKIVAHDPIAMPMAKQYPVLDGIALARDWQEALSGSDACCVITSWPEYRSIHADMFLKLMRNPLVIDGRGIFANTELAAGGVRWRGIGYTPAS